MLGFLPPLVSILQLFVLFEFGFARQQTNL